MDGYRVDTTALTAVGKQYHAISQRLTENASRLRRALEILNKQTLAAEWMESLLSAAKAVEASALETLHFGDKCKDIASIYLATEDQVKSALAALPEQPILEQPFLLSAQAALLLSQTGSHSDSFSEGSLDSDELAALGTIRVDSPYRSAKPVLLSGNLLTCEDWLFNRLTQTQMEA